MKKIIKAKSIVLEAEQRLMTQAAAMVPRLRVELLENRQAVVEGCKGVLEYSEDCIRLSSDRTILRFTGTDLALKTFSGGSAIVEGRISGLEFM